MLRALLREIAGKAAAAQDDPLLREVAAGGARFESVVFTRNRRVMASVADGGRTLRLHRAFAEAPADVLAALGRLFAPRSTPAARARARTRIRGYLAAALPPPPPAAPPRARALRPRSDDLPHLARLRAEFDAVNARYFAGELPAVPIRLSGRMRRRNGHFSSDPLEIAIARTLCERGAPGESERTLRHEMIHLWQWREGRRPGHGSDFRRWARRLGIHPRATRTVAWADELEASAGPAAFAAPRNPR